MSRTLYTAEAEVTGGRANGSGRTSDGALEVDIRAPTELGGDGSGTNPEQLFAVGYAACFGSALELAARRRRVEIGASRVGSRVALVTGEDRSFAIEVELDVLLPEVADPAQAAELVAAADAVCPYSNAIRGNVDVAITANGEPVSG
jgi:osmotically inducible protein OsmC